MAGVDEGECSGEVAVNRAGAVGMRSRWFLTAAERSLAPAT